MLQLVHWFCLPFPRSYFWSVWKLSTAQRDKQRYLIRQANIQVLLLTDCPTGTISFSVHMNNCVLKISIWKTELRKRWFLEHWVLHMKKIWVFGSYNVSSAGMLILVQHQGRWTLSCYIYVCKDHRWTLFWDKSNIVNVRMDDITYAVRNLLVVDAL